MMQGTWVGGLQILIPKYDVEQVLTAIRTYRPTYFPAVPTIFVSLLSHPRVHEFGLEEVRHFNSGGAPKPFPFLRTSFSEANGQFSPDGGWIAYQSNESGRFEIYAAPFPGPGGKRQISTSGGVLPRWRHEGKEIFYVAPDLRLMAAPVNIHEGALDVGAARPLFGPISTTVSYAYDVSLDGQHILSVSAPERRASQQLTLVQS
jgi:acyl-CoA synthetase (AMP-forming)/AMP-acid ligase II